jgi:glycerophosphoryl diester phosphodiesterase
MGKKNVFSVLFCVQILSIYGGTMITTEKTLVVAHRGVSAHYPENTLLAFKKAIGIADMIELDVTLSKDEEVVVIHDDILDRTTNGQGDVKDYSLGELKILDAGNGEEIPTLAEVLQEVGGRIFINIELKIDETTGCVSDLLIRKCLDLVCEYDLLQSILFSSFDKSAIKKIKEIESKFTCFLLHSDRDVLLGGIIPQRFIDLVKLYQADGITFDQKRLGWWNQKMISVLNREGICVGAYTVDVEQVAEKLKYFGVNLVFSNDPEKIISVSRG